MNNALVGAIIFLNILVMAFLFGLGFWYGWYRGMKDGIK